jgi:hypothetical protein
VTSNFKKLTNFLVELGVDEVAHSNKSFLAHLIGVYKLMEAKGCSEELCQAGMFHSIYGTQQFQGFKLGVERRPDIRALIGERAERLAYLNCAMFRPSFDAAVLEQTTAPYRFTDRLTNVEVTMDQADFDDLCRVHLYDWLEQVPRSRYGWGFRREAYRRMADRLDDVARKSYDEVFAQEPVAS